MSTILRDGEGNYYTVNGSTLVKLEVVKPDLTPVTNGTTPRPTLAQALKVSSAAVLPTAPTATVATSLEALKAALGIAPAAPAPASLKELILGTTKPTVAPEVKDRCAALNLAAKADWKPGQGCPIHPQSSNGSVRCDAPVIDARKHKNSTRAAQGTVVVKFKCGHSINYTA